jgi:hypothetical protein
MTATEPDLTLLALADRESEVDPEPSRWGLVGRALLGSLGGVLLSVVLSLIFFEGSYAGVRDDGAAEQAVAAYRPYLEAIGRQLAWLGLGQALCLTPAVLGLLLLLRAHPRTRGWVRGRVLLPMLLGLMVVSAFGSAVAYRHPGLFLSLLTGSSFLMWSARFGLVLAVLVFGAAALGYVFTALRPRQTWVVALACGAAIVLPLGAWLTSLLLPGPVRVFGQRGPADKAAAALPPATKERSPYVIVLAVVSLLQ